MRNAVIKLAIHLWRTDASFSQYPYGPPMYGLRNRLAWWLYHAAIRGEA